MAPTFRQCQISCRSRWLLSVTLASSLAFSAQAGTAGTIRRVDVRSPIDGPGDKSDWSNAAHCLQDALDQAQAGDLIFVAQGTHKPDQGRRQKPGDRAVSFTIKIDGLRILGGFAGFGERFPELQNPAKFKTVLSGDLPGDDDPAAPRTWLNNARHVMTTSGLSQRSLIDGLVITAGHANDLDVPRGGGMLNTGSSPRITRITFLENWATAGAGMMNRDHSSPTVIDCTFERNATTLGNGGGMFNVDGSAPMIIGCAFLGNRAVHVGGGVAVRAMVPGQMLCLNRCVFVGNNAKVAGGGMRAGHSSQATIANCTFIANSVGPATPQGFPNGGGGLAVGADKPGSLVGEVFIWNSIFQENFLDRGNLKLPLIGPQIAHNGGQPLNLQVAFCDVQYSGTDGKGDGVFVQSGFPMDWQAGNIDAPAKFIRDPHPGPDGRWGTPDDDYGDLRLRDDSPCIDRGSLRHVVFDGFSAVGAGQPDIGAGIGD